MGDTKDWPGVAEVKYEYLDHTADVQLHAWGATLAESFEQAGVAMFGYMTEIEKVDVSYTYDIQATGSDADSLLFHFLDEWLFAFSAEPFFIPRTVKIVEFDREQWTLKARGWGESFDIAKHPQGTEVKAITYSNMQIHENEGRVDTYVIVDI
uniref:Archease domain-containing protein n=1 Tax=Plectus sambesii TaxID=2011161 RepID=A0A914UV83_9BILA